jgi:hypothetical protein
MATSTPTPAPPTATATLAPAPRLFTEEFDVGVPHWAFLQSAGQQIPAAPSVGNGFLRFDLAGMNQWVYEIYDPHEYADVRIDARIEFGSAVQAAAGLMCRYDAAAGWYEFNIYADQTYVLLFGEWLVDGVAQYTPLVQSTSEKIDQVANEIGLLCEGSTLTPYINGVQMRRREETAIGLTEGKIGVSAASFENAPVMIAYDWLRVASP